MTGAALINAALKALNVLSAGEVPDANDANDSLLRLNDWLDALGTQDFSVYYLLRTVVPLVNGTANYTIGTGGAVNIPRPVSIDHAGLVLPATPVSQEVPTTVFTDQMWQSIGQKSYSATYPQGIYYDYNWVSGLATITVYPVPNTSTASLVLYTPSALTEMTLAGDVTFPPGYRRFLRYGLARELSAEFGGWSDAKEALYQSAWQWVQQQNLRMSDLTIDPMFGHGRSNVYTGEV